MTTEPQPQAQPEPLEPRRRASAGSIFAGVFLILLALCLILAGGGCTIALLVMFQDVGTDGFGLLLLSLVTLGAGAVAMWFGARLITGKYD